MKRTGRATVSTYRPRAFAVCDRCGFVYNHDDLIWQNEWRGPQLQNLRFLVCQPCLDKPQEQLRTFLIPADPIPIDTPRPEDYNAEVNASDNSWNPADTQAEITLSNLNCTATRTVETVPGSYVNSRALFGLSTGKWYYQGTVNALTDDGNQGVGIGNATATLGGLDPTGVTEWIGWDNNSVALYNGGIFLGNNVVVGSDDLLLDLDDILQVAVNISARRIWFAVNGGNWNGSATADPSGNIGGVDISVIAGDLYPMLTLFDLDDQMTATFAPSLFNNYEAPAGFIGWIPNS
jgi:hypothetical protein